MFGETDHIAFRKVRELRFYHLELNSCSNCGAKLEMRLIDEVARKACPECAFVHWGSYSISVGALLVKDEKMLLVRRKHNPGKGKWIVIGWLY